MGHVTRPRSGRARESVGFPCLRHSADALRGGRPHGERPLYGGGSQVARKAAFYGPESQSLAQVPGNPLELVVTGRRRSGRPAVFFPCNPQRFAARGRSPHTREVAGSNPAAPIRREPAWGTGLVRRDDRLPDLRSGLVEALMEASPRLRDPADEAPSTSEDDLIPWLKTVVIRTFNPLPAIIATFEAACPE
jgi:hypothetical protein